MQKGRFIIVDGNALVHRAFHALPPLSTKNGQLVNAVYGFLAILLRAFKELQPEYAAVAFDLPAPTFRHELFREYKAQRQKQPQELYDQIPVAKQVLNVLGIPVFEKAGFEADDLIATLVEKTKKNKTENIVVTGDMDTLQLVDERTRVFTLKKGINDTAIYDAKAVEERYGLKPEQMNDYKALRGDPSDNIPGVRGIGEKGATELIQKFGSVEAIYKHLLKCGQGHDECGLSEKQKTLLSSQEQEALLGKQLVILNREVPMKFSLDDCRFGKAFDQTALEKLFADLQFKKFFNQAVEIFTGKTPVPERKKEVRLKDLADVKELNEVALKAKSLSLVCAFSGHEARHASLSGISVYLDSGDSYFVSIKNKQDLRGLQFLQNEEIIKWVHDAKFLHEVLSILGLKLNAARDTMILAYLLNPGARQYDLDTLAWQELQVKPAPPSLSLGVDKTELAGRASLIWQLQEKLMPKIEEQGLKNLFEKVEMLLSGVLAKMEMTGIKIDEKFLQKLSQEFGRKLEKISREIYKLAGQEFNINSPAQLREVLFDKMALSPARADGKMPRIRRTQGGEISTAASELEKLRGVHPIVDFIFEHRELAKLKSTYADALPSLIDKEDGRVHTSYNQTVTATGRLSSSNPNLQNIPARTEAGREIRKAFIAEEGNILLSADYSQIELRLAASLSGDPQMIKAFQSGEDFHRRTAALVAGVSMDKVTDEMRRAAKAVNFGVLYGMGPGSLAESTGFSRAEAEDFIFNYFKTFKKLRDFLDSLIEQARTMGFVETLFGRRRYLPEIISGVPQVRAAAERMALNHPIQGTAADLIKMAMIELDKNIKIQEYKNKVRMLLQVHDELVFEAKENLVKEAAPQIKKIMEEVYVLKVPIVVDVKKGKNWEEMEGLWL